MSKPSKAERAPKGRREYDFRGGVRGKHAKRIASGATVVVLDPQVARAFPDSEAVNAALRDFLHRRRARGASARR